MKPSEKKFWQSTYLVALEALMNPQSTWTTGGKPAATVGAKTDICKDIADQALENARAVGAV